MRAAHSFFILDNKLSAMKSFLVSILLLTSVAVSAQTRGEAIYRRAESDLEALFKDCTKGNYSKIEEQYRTAVKVLHEEKNDSLAALALCRLGEMETVDMKMSAGYYRKALELYDRPGSWPELNAKVSIYMMDALLSDPVSAWKKSQKLEDRIAKVDRVDNLISLRHRQAITAQKAGDYAELIKQMEIIRSIPTENFSIEQILQMDAIGSYATCIASMGAKEEALTIIEGMLDMLNNYFDKGVLPLSFGRYMHDAGVVMRCLGSDDEAFDCLTLSKDFYLDIFGKNYMELMHTRKQLALVLTNLNRPDEAITELKEVIPMICQSYGDTCYEMMTATLFYSLALLNKLDIGGSIKMVNECIRNLEAVHATVPDPYVLQLSLYMMKGDGRHALESAKKLLELARKYVRDGLIVLTESEREAFWVHNGVQITGSIFLAAAKLTDTEGLLYDTALFSKGILMTASRQLGSIIEADSSGRLAVMQERYRDLYYRSAYLAQGDEASQQEAETLRQQARTAELELMSASKALGDILQETDCTWKDVSRVLSPGDAAIEFIRYEEYGNVFHYIASVLLPGKKPVNVPLSKLTDELIQKETMDGTAYSSNTLFKAIFDPLMPYIRGCRRIWFAPSGALTSVALESITSTGWITTSDMFDMRRVSSTRSLLHRKDVGAWTSAVLFGGIDYNLSPEEMEYYGETVGKRGPKSQHSWPFLRGTLNEVNEIAGVLEGTMSLSLYTGAEGVEEQFAALSGSHPSLIHVATHGYYPDDVTKLVGYDAITIENVAMELCGLVFAGANTARGTNGQGGNGLLSAAEIAKMDLSGCDLVVLSACGTGLGVINFDESFGLMRAFKKAGVSSILMSLWDVDDSITAEFMAAFYRARQESQDNHKALMKAQATVRRAHPKPKDWAGFVLID